MSSFVFFLPKLTRILEFATPFTNPIPVNTCDGSIAPDVHTRKAMMESLSDIFLVLPGGFGTLDEFFEILTWRQLGFHNKPIVLLNINGYFDGLLHFIDRGLNEDFLQLNALNLFSVATNFDECMEIIQHS